MKKLYALLLMAPIALVSPSLSEGRGLSTASKKISEMQHGWEYAKGFRYIPDQKDNWQTPYETWERDGGDCEDMAIYLYDYFRERGIQSELIIGRVKDQGKMLPGVHAWIKKGEEIYDPSLKVRGSVEELKKQNLQYIPDTTYNGEIQDYLEWLYNEK